MPMTPQNEERMLDALDGITKRLHVATEDGKAIATATLAAALVAKMDNPNEADAERCFSALWSSMWGGR